MDRAQAVKKIFAKASRQYLCAQVPVRGGDQPHVDVPYFGRAYSLDFPVLNHAQKFRLHRQRSFSHFIQKHRSAVRELEESRPRVGGPRKRPAYVPEELALQQRVHHCGTVTHRQLLLAHRTDLVDGPGDQLFSRSRRPHQQNVGVVARNFPRKVKHLQHRGTLPNDAMKFQVLKQLLFERPHAPPLVVQRSNVIQRPLQPRAVDRLRHEIRRSPPDRFQRRFQCVIPGHENNVRSGVTTRYSIQELVSVHSRHVHIDQHQAAMATLYQLECFFRAGSKDGLISYVRDHRRQHFQLRRIVIQDARRQR